MTRLKDARIAVVHDRFCNKGGGEQVALALAKHFNADVFTAKYDPEKTFEGVKDLNLKEVNPGKTFQSEFVDAIERMRDAHAFSKLVLKDYDAVIASGAYAFFASRKNPHVTAYCHTPSRWLYDMYYPYKRHFFSKGPVYGVGYVAWKNFWEPFDQHYFKKVKSIVANSRNVGLRIQRYYGREDYTVINPPVNLEQYKSKKSEDFYLSVQRVGPAKRLDLQLDVFEQLPNERLVIVGQAEYGTDYQERMAKRIEKMDNVKWLGRVSDKEVKDLYSRCKAVIQTPMFEDFGMVPVEAMASGKPCIAVNEEGMTESVIHGETGLLVDPPYKEGFVKAIKNFDKYEFKASDCHKRAAAFSEDAFARKMDAVLLGSGLR